MSEETIRIHPRESEAVSLPIPKETIISLQKIAAIRDMSMEALLRFYIGQGLRQDMSRLFSDHVLQTTAQVLARHLESTEEVSAILQEIRESAEPYQALQ